MSKLQVPMILEAERLGAEITSNYPDRPQRWYWIYGTHCRSSNDHYGLGFNTPGEAAEHFLASREGLNAKRRKP